jgi:hypothetical protein
MLGQRLAAMAELGELRVDGLQIQQAQLRTIVGPNRPHPPRKPEHCYARGHHLR